MQTTFDLKGANCGLCFNVTLEALAHVDGVNSVHGSISESRIVIDHRDDVSTQKLVETMHRHLHGVEMYSNEIRMVPIDPDALSLPCPHH